VATPVGLIPPFITTVQPVVVIGPKLEILSTSAVGGFGRVLNVPPVKGISQREFNVVLDTPITVPHEFVASTCAPYVVLAVNPVTVADNAPVPVTVAGVVEP
jgi:hypothetical protein